MPDPTRYECRECDGGHPCVYVIDSPMPGWVRPGACVWSDSDEFKAAHWRRADP